MNTSLARCRARLRTNPLGQTAPAVLAVACALATRSPGENYNAPWSIALYGLVLLFAGVAHFILTKALVAHHGLSSRRATSIGKDRKRLANVVIYVNAIRHAFVWPKAAYGCYILVAVMWLLPDRRSKKLGRALDEDNSSQECNQ